jgi:hypothetical protein
VRVGPTDQAGDKLSQVGAVSELDKAAQAVPPPAGGGRGREGGVRAAARELGISRTDAQGAVRRVHRIAPAVREALRDMPEIADNGAELDALAPLPAELANMHRRHSWSRAALFPPLPARGERGVLATAGGQEACPCHEKGGKKIVYIQ